LAGSLPPREAQPLRPGLHLPRPAVRPRPRGLRHLRGSSRAVPHLALLEQPSSKPPDVGSRQAHLPGPRSRPARPPATDPYLARPGRSVSAPQSTPWESDKPAEAWAAAAADPAIAADLEAVYAYIAAAV